MMKIKRTLISILMVSIFTVSCASTLYWQKANTTIIEETDKIAIFSIPSNEFRPAPGMFKVKTFPTKIPDGFFMHLSMLENLDAVMTKYDFSFVRDFPSDWIKHLEKGIAESGNSTIYFKSKPRKYYSFSVYAPDKKKQLKTIRAFSKRFYNAIISSDPSGNKQYIEVFVKGTAYFKTMSLLAVFDSKGIDFFWYKTKGIGHKSFELN